MFPELGGKLILIRTGRPALDSDVLGGGSQCKSYGRPTYVGALMLGYHTSTKGCDSVRACERGWLHRPVRWGSVIVRKA